MKKVTQGHYVMINEKYKRKYTIRNDTDILHFQVTYYFIFQKNAINYFACNSLSRKFV